MMNWKKLYEQIDATIAQLQAAIKTAARMCGKARVWRRAGPRD